MQHKTYSAACERNKLPILDHLKHEIMPNSSVLEVACGSGQHASYFAPRLRVDSWLPSDFDQTSIVSTDAYRREIDCNTLRAPIQLDCTHQETWPHEVFDAILCCNMIHIAPWEAGLGLLKLASTVLKEDTGRLILYGPFIQEGIATAPSNIEFDASLRSRDPSWGIRHLEEVKKAAQEHQLRFQGTHDMPANNLLVVFQRSSL